MLMTGLAAYYGISPEPLIAGIKTTHINTVVRHNVLGEITHKSEGLPIGHYHLNHVITAE